MNPSHNNKRQRNRKRAKKWRKRMRGINFCGKAIQSGARERERGTSNFQLKRHLSLKAEKPMRRLGNPRKEDLLKFSGLSLLLLPPIFDLFSSYSPKARETKVEISTFRTYALNWKTSQSLAPPSWHSIYHRQIFGRNWGNPPSSRAFEKGPQLESFPNI